jgi:protein-tyrosine kinase
MVTSSMPGEGKSFCSINLAMSMAMEMNRTVLLVDADVARPSLPATLGIPESPGLLDVLDGKSVKLSQVLTRTNVEKLTYLSSGRRDPRATEMLASEAMSALLAELRTRYPDRIFIFDSPPLLVTTEARVLANHMGQIVFVVDAERTLRNDVKRALATIEACPVKLLVLNKARTSGQGAYGYGYGYGN